jgi:hypothetical protein
MLKYPIHELPSNIVIDNFYARLALHDKDYLDASCFGSFTHIKEDAKWNLLDHIQKNAEGWENDKGRRSGINYDYECIKTFMGTDDFHNVSTAYGIDSQILANCFKAFASYLDVPKKDWTKYHAPYKDSISHSPATATKVCAVDSILPEPYFEKTPCRGDDLWAHHGLSNMPAGVPGVPATPTREDRHRPKGRLRQQPVGDSTEENQSRAVKTKLPNGCLAKSRLAPIRATEAKDGMTPATTGLSQSEIEGPSPRRDPRQKRRDMPSRCRSQGKGTL